MSTNCTMKGKLVPAFRTSFFLLQTSAQLKVGYKITKRYSSGRFDFNTVFKTKKVLTFFRLTRETVPNCPTPVYNNSKHLQSKILPSSLCTTNSFRLTFSGYAFSLGSFMYCQCCVICLTVGSSAALIFSSSFRARRVA